MAYERTKEERRLGESEQLVREMTLEASVLAEFYEYHRIEEP